MRIPSRKKTQFSPALGIQFIGAMLPLNLVPAASLWFFYAIFGYCASVGRGHSVGFYLDTATDTYSVSAFSPIVAIPFGELVEKYGEPDVLWLFPGGRSNVPSTLMVLHWDAIGMFVELPGTENETYFVEKTTRIEKIIFFDEEKEGQVLAIDRKQFGAQKLQRKGYGHYPQ